MAILEEGQFELAGIVFGADCPVEVAEFEPGVGELDTADLRPPGRDGTVFGRDRRAGPVLTWEMFTMATTATGGKADWEQLQAVWDAPHVRSSPLAAMPLRLRLPGGQTRLIYGRPRRFEIAESRLLSRGRVQWVADFQASDTVFYDDSADGGQGGARSITLTLIADSSQTGIVWPVTWPVTWGAQGERQDTIVNAGTAGAWPTITFAGPVAQPSLDIVSTGLTLRLDTTIAFDQTITIDTRASTILRSDGASMAGVVRGASLSDFRLPVGQTVLAYRGTDLSGQSTCTISWRDAYSTP